MNLQKEIAHVQGDLETNKQIGQYSLQLVCPASVVSLILIKGSENRGMTENTEKDNSEQFLS